MCDEMADRFLTDFELMVILAVLRARDDAYGVAIAREIEQTGGRPVTHAAVYLALNRLTQHGLVTSRLGDPTPERGERARKLFSASRPPAWPRSDGPAARSWLSGRGFPN